MSFAQEVYDYLSGLDGEFISDDDDEYQFSLREFVQEGGFRFNERKYDCENIKSERDNSSYIYIMRFSDDNNECFIRWNVPYSSWEGIMWEYGEIAEEVVPKTVSVVQYNTVKQL